MQPKEIRNIPLTAVASFAYGVVMGGWHYLHTLIIGFIVTTVVLMIAFQSFRPWATFVALTYYLFGWLVGRMLFLPRMNLMLTAGRMPWAVTADYDAYISRI